MKMHYKDLIFFSSCQCMQLPSFRRHINNAMSLKMFCTAGDLQYLHHNCPFLFFGSCVPCASLCRVNKQICKAQHGLLFIDIQGNEMCSLILFETNPYRSETTLVLESRVSASFNSLWRTHAFSWYVFFVFSESVYPKGRLQTLIRDYKTRIGY